MIPHTGFRKHIDIEAIAEILIERIDGFDFGVRTLVDIKKRRCNQHSLHLDSQAIGNDPLSIRPVYLRAGDPNVFFNNMVSVLVTSYVASSFQKIKSHSCITRVLAVKAAHKGTTSSLSTFS